MPRTTDTQWRHKLKISEKLGRCGRQNMLPPYLKIWDWDWIFGRAVKVISSLGVSSPWNVPYRLPFCKQKSSQSQHLKGLFLPRTDSMCFLSFVLLKVIFPRSHNVYNWKASFPHELFKLTFCEKHSWQSLLLQKGLSHIMSTIWSPSRRDNTWCSYRAIKMAICMGW